MMTLKQKQSAQMLINDLQDLKGNACRLESGKLKGRTVDENDENIAQAMNSLTQEFSKIAMSMSKLFDSKGMEMTAEKYSKAQSHSPADVTLYIEEILKDIEELEKQADKKLRANEKREAQKEIAEKQAEEFNKTAEREHNARARRLEGEKFVAREPKSFAGSVLSGDGRYQDRVSVISRVPTNWLENLAKSGKGMGKPKKQKKLKNSSNIRVAKSSEAKKREEQKALRKRERQMTKGEPAMARQMSR